MNSSRSSGSTGASTRTVAPTLPPLSICNAAKMPSAHVIVAQVGPGNTNIAYSDSPISTRRANGIAEGSAYVETSGARTPVLAATWRTEEAGSRAGVGSAAGAAGAESGRTHV